ncbi:unnamed protein product, partial [Rotaria magnacalcarata]
MFENRCIVALNLSLTMFVVAVVAEEYVPNWYDFAEEFLELDLIVDRIHVQ